MKKLATATGILISIISLLYVGMLFKKYAQDIKVTEFTTNTILLFNALLILQTTLCYILTSAWRNILLSQNAPITRLTAIKIYGISQLAKYIPGNIFHYVGKQLLGQAEGIPAKTLIKSSLIEIIISIAGASIFILLYLANNITSDINHYNYYAPIITTLLIIATITIRKYQLLPTKILVSLIQYLFFFLCSGIIFLLILKTISSTLQINTALSIHLISTYVIAWLAGFLIPGAPAGLGVREIVLLSLINAHSTEPELLLTIIISRAIQLIGEIIFFILSILSHRINT